MCGEGSGHLGQSSTSPAADHSANTMVEVYQGHAHRKLEPLGADALTVRQGGLEAAYSHDLGGGNICSTRSRSGSTRTSTVSPALMLERPGPVYL